MGFMYEKGALFLYSEVCRQTLQERTHMIKDNMHLPTLKEIETDVIITKPLNIIKMNELIKESNDEQIFVAGVSIWLK